MRHTLTTVLIAAILLGACTSDTGGAATDATSDATGSDVSGPDGIAGSDLESGDVPVTDVLFTDMVPGDVPPPDVMPIDVPPTDVGPADVPLPDVPPADVPATDVMPGDVAVPDVPVADVPTGDGAETADTSCTPDCASKVCGDDGCGGECGTCSGDEACSAGACLSHCMAMVATCTPSLSEVAGAVCDNPTFAPCLDLMYVDFQVNGCSTACTAMPLPGLNDVCAAPECVDLKATLSGFAVITDECTTCACTPVACGAGSCGDDGCGGSCGACEAPLVCMVGVCESCTGDCTGKACGDDGCGGSCGACGATEVCDASQLCVTACDGPADCLDIDAFVCAVDTQTCSESQCNTGPTCGADQLCFTQGSGLGAAAPGACYTLCNSLDPDSCGVGMDCDAVGNDPGLGVCVNTGQSALGDACVASVTATGCQPGLVCVGDGTVNTCRRWCNVLLDTNGCVADSICSVGGFCDDTIDTSFGDPAQIGEACGSEPGTFCGNDGSKVGGVCDGGGVCSRMCSFDQDTCGALTVCTEVFATLTIGLCQ